MNTKVLAAAQAVVEAARANMDTCVALVCVRAGWPKASYCGELASHTINSNSHPACSVHAAMARKENNSVFDHGQLPLLKAVEDYDACVADAAREALGGGK